MNPALLASLERTQDEHPDLEYLRSLFYVSDDPSSWGDPDNLSYSWDDADVWST